MSKETTSPKGLKSNRRPFRSGIPALVLYHDIETIPRIVDAEMSRTEGHHVRGTHTFKFRRSNAVGGSDAHARRNDAYLGLDLKHFNVETEKINVSS